MDIIYQCTKNEDTSIQQIAVQCIVEIVRFNYKYLEQYIADVTEVTLEVAKSGDDGSKAQAMEVWTSIAEEEIYLEEEGRQHLKIIERGFETIQQLALQVLEDYEFYDDLEDNVWGPSTSAACCLKFLAKLSKNAIVQPIIDYSGNKLGSQVPKDLNTGLLALGSIIDGPDAQEIYSQFNPAMPTFVDLIKHQNPKVRDSAAWLVNVITEHCPELIQ